MRRRSSANSSANSKPRCLQCDTIMRRVPDKTQVLGKAWTCLVCLDKTHQGVIDELRQALSNAHRENNLLVYRLVGIKQAWGNLEATKLPDGDKTYGEVFDALSESSASSLHADGLQTKLASRTIKDLI